MAEISQRLQHSMIEIADLGAKLLTERVGLDDQLAELTLEKQKELALDR